MALPDPLTIKAHDIERWADTRLDARSLLSVLLRKLVHSAETPIRKIDFPGHDNSQRKGPDGYLDSAEATAWVPEGESYWEFGTDKRPGKKADSDYASRTGKTTPQVRSEATFVFVTPRNWPGKTRWERDKASRNDWKSVRALDASDIEQWLERSPATQTWLAESIGLPSEGCESLEHFWQRWATATEPPLTQTMFAPLVAEHRRRDTLRHWLERPTNKPLIVAADSRDEGLAFLASLIEGPELSRLRDSCVIVTTNAALKRLRMVPSQFIPIVYSESVERDLGGDYGRKPSIVVRSTQLTHAEPDVIVEVPKHADFREALRAMGLDRERAERLALESGRSPTVLRRRLSKNLAIREPGWACNEDFAPALVPLTLVGTWNAKSPADRDVVARVTGLEHELVDKQFSRLLLHDDPPVWTADGYHGLTAKVDALFAIAKWITVSDIDRFFSSAETVLSEADPALDLPEGERWLAQVRGKVRAHSRAIRASISETLVLLSIHGDRLFGRRLGVGVEGRVRGLVWKLMSPLTSDKILSHLGELSHFAEAAPDAFLKLLEDDLRQEQPAVMTLMLPTSGLFGTPMRTQLLRALEGLAWNAETMPRVCVILAKLSTRHIDDNWTNKPEASLHAIFRPWMPQTRASVEQRLKVVRALSISSPTVAWSLCIRPVKHMHRQQAGMYSHQPRWRDDASGAGEPVLRSDYDAFIRGIIELMLAWPAHTEQTIGDLVECMGTLREPDEVAVWSLIDAWSATADDDAKARVRERIRCAALGRKRRHCRLDRNTRDRAASTHEKLRSQNSVVRILWLFSGHWVELTENEVDEELDFWAREAKVADLRRSAMSEVFAQYGVDGIFDLAARGRPTLVGEYASYELMSLEAQLEFVRRCLDVQGDRVAQSNDCLTGFLGAKSVESRLELVRAAMSASHEPGRLFSCMPFNASTWRLLDECDGAIRIKYWRDIQPREAPHDPMELSEIIDRLMQAGRPRAALHAVHLYSESIETDDLLRILVSIGPSTERDAELYRWSSYDFSKLFELLGARADASRVTLAELEFAFIEVLDDEAGLPNLERIVADSPSDYAQFVAWVYKRQTPDPAESEGADDSTSDGRRVRAHVAWMVLDRLRRLPGTDDDTGRIDAKNLARWIEETRRCCQSLGRADMGDYCVGEYLARGDRGDEGMRPSAAVCAALERFASEYLGEGFKNAIRNSRGFHMREEGGRQERELASSYRSSADRVRFEYPYVGSLLDDIASSYESEGAWQDARAVVSRRMDDS